MTLFRYLTLKHRFLPFYFFVFSLVLVAIYQTVETLFHRLSKHIEFCQKYSSARRSFNSLILVFENVVKQGVSRLIYYLTRYLFSFD